MARPKTSRIVCRGSAKATSRRKGGWAASEPIGLFRRSTRRAASSPPSRSRQLASPRGLRRNRARSQRRGWRRSFRRATKDSRCQIWCSRATQCSSRRHRRQPRQCWRDIRLSRCRTCSVPSTAPRCRRRRYRLACRRTRAASRKSPTYKYNHSESNSTMITPFSRST